MLTVNQRDPTLTTVLRTTYSREIAERFKKVGKLITKSVVSNDALRLASQRTVIALQSRPLTRLDLPASDAQRIAAFVDWLRDIMQIEILEGSEIAPGLWQNRFVREAYLRGVNRANDELRKAGLLQGATFAPIPLELPGVLVPVNDAALQVLFLNNFELLKSVNEQVLGNIRQILVEGILEGINPNLMGKRMTLQLGIGLRNAQRIARTEIIRAYNEGALNRYEMLGVEGVTAQVEFATAGDERVCKKCRGLDGRIYTTKNAHGVIPVHPNCRCTWLPHIRSLN